MRLCAEFFHCGLLFETGCISMQFNSVDCLCTIYRQYITYCLLVTQSFCQCWSQISQRKDFNGRQSRSSFRDVICSIGNLLSLVPLPFSASGQLCKDDQFCLKPFRGQMVDNFRKMSLLIWTKSGNCPPWKLKLSKM